MLMMDLDGMPEVLYIYFYLSNYFFDIGKLNLNAKSYNIHAYTVIHYAHRLHLIQPTYAFKRSLE